MRAVIKELLAIASDALRVLPSIRHALEIVTAHRSQGFTLRFGIRYTDSIVTHELAVTFLIRCCTIRTKRNRVAALAFKPTNTLRR
jgi:hypothetical protein